MKGWMPNLEEMLRFNLSINELDDKVLRFKPAGDRELISRLDERKRSKHILKVREIAWILQVKIK